MNRRRLLRTTGIALTAGLAGCGGNGDTETDDGDSPAPTESDTPGGMETPTPEPETPTPEPDTPTPDQETPTPEPDTPTPTPDESTPTPEPSTPTPEPAPTVQVVIDNVGIEAWTVVSDESGSVAPTDTENPTMTFEVGTRYVVGNRAREFHPFALRDADGVNLLSQSGSGSFESDSAVNWRDDGSELAFTMTSDLAGALDYYTCTRHNAMRGDARTN
jgi:hypothetical protein